MKFNQELKNQIAETLRKRLAIQRCSRCNSLNFSVVDGFAQITLGQDTQNIELGNTIPCAVIACDNCGNLSFHALGALGLLQK